MVVKEGSFEENYEKKQRQEEKEVLEKVRKGVEEVRREKKKIKEKTEEKEPAKQATIDDVQMEPVMHEGKPMWLVIKKRKMFPVVPGISIEKQLKDPLDPEIQTTYTIERPCLWQCKRCGAIVESNPESPIECEEKKGGCGRKSHFSIITEAVPVGIWKLPQWQDLDDLDMLDVFDRIIKLMKELVIFQDEMQYKIIALWIIASWKREHWETVGFPVFRGLRNSGKTTALNIINELAYRAVPASNITFAALGRVSHYWHVTLLVDEANNRLNPKTELGAIMLDYVKASYKRGSKYITADLNDQKKVIPIDNFGFKAFAGEKHFDPSLVTRALDFFMEQGTPEVPKISYLQGEIDDLQTRLLNYRYKICDPPDLGEDFALKGRTREIYESLIATGMNIGILVDDVLNYALEVEQEKEDEMRNSVQYEILVAIKDRQEIRTLDDVALDMMRLTELFSALGWDEIEDSQERRAKRQSLGYILRDMGLKTTHMRDGKYLPLSGKNGQRIKNLYKRYKVE